MNASNFQGVHLWIFTLLHFQLCHFSEVQGSVQFLEEIVAKPEIQAISVVSGKKFFIE